MRSLNSRLHQVRSAFGAPRVGSNRARLGRSSMTNAALERLEGRLLLTATSAPSLFLSPTTITAGTNPVAITTGDFNSDGILDMAVANYNAGTVSVFQGNGSSGVGNGTFSLLSTITVDANPTAILAVDLRSNGTMDLAVTSGTTSLNSVVSILLGNGDGTFQNKVDYSTIDKVSKTVANGVTTLLPTYNEGWGPDAIASGFVDGSGHVDLVTANGAFDKSLASNTISVLRGNGDGTFGTGSGLLSGAVATFVGSGPESVSVGDLNYDPMHPFFNDIVTANRDSKSISYLKNDKTAVVVNSTFTYFPAGNRTDITVGNNPSSVIIADLGGPTKGGTATYNLPLTTYNDVAVANEYDNTVSVLLNNASGTLAAPVNYAVGSSPLNLITDDFNTDGKPDLAVANSSNNSISVLINKGDATFNTKIDVAVSTAPTALVAGDFNGDGSTDIAATNFNDSTVTILINRKDGIFGTKNDYTIGSSPSSVATGDVNADGKLDLISTNAGSNTVNIQLGNGDGTFQAATTFNTGVNPQYVAVGDFNGDGKADLVVANADSNTVSILLGNGNGAFQPKVDYLVGTYAKSIAVGDFNHDGKLDIAVASSGGAVSVLLGNGDGTFRNKVDYVVPQGANSIAAGDFNGDGVLDLAVTSQGYSIRGNDGTIVATLFSDVTVLLGNGDGTFKTGVTYDTAGTALTVALGDFNADGNLDIIVGALTGTFGSVSVLLGNGDGTFGSAISSPAGLQADSIAVGDFNGDGKADVATANGGTTSETVLLGNGDGTFQIPVGQSADIYLLSQIITGDFNRDGRPDLAITTAADTVAVLLNTHLSTSTSLSASLSTLNPGQAVTFSTLVTANSGVPTGTVTFYDSGTLIGTGTLVNGATTLTVSNLLGGTHSITAIYSGDNTYDASQSAVTKVISLYISTTALSVASRSVIVGQSDVLTAVVASITGVPTGTVTFYDGTTSLGVATLANGVATFTAASFSLGSHAIRAVYSGDNSYYTSTSATITATSKQASTTNLAALHQAVLSGQSDTLTATVTYVTTGTAATGTVTFYDGAGIIGTGTLPGVGTANAGSFTETVTLTLGSLIGGSHAFTAVYSGDTNYGTSTSAIDTVEQAIGDGQLTPEYRLYSSITKEHFYTTDANEYAVLATKPGWTQEGIKYQIFNAPITIGGVTTEAWYRLYNAASLQHFLTADVNEYNTLATRGWTKEGITGYIFATPVLAGTLTVSTPLYRLYNSASGGLHIWTTDINEYNTLSTQGWKKEGIIGDVIDSSGL